MKLLKALIFAAGLVGIYKIVQNARVNPSETFLDGWQQTAEHMRPTPKSAIELANESHVRAPLPGVSLTDE